MLTRPPMPRLTVAMTMWSMPTSKRSTTTRNNPSDNGKDKARRSDPAGFSFGPQMAPASGLAGIFVRCADQLVQDARFRIGVARPFDGIELRFRPGPVSSDLTDRALRQGGKCVCVVFRSRFFFDQF